MILLEPKRTPWDLKWKMLGVPVRVHPLFWLIAFILGYNARGSGFEFVFLYIACVFISILCHEFGHALSGRYYGDRGNRVVLWQLGGLCIHGEDSPGRWPRIFVLLWGPGAGFILGLMALPVMLSVPKSAYIDFAAVNLVVINFAWGVANLMPVFPLDGGQIMREVVHWKFPQKGDVFVFTFSMYAALVLVAVGAGWCVYQVSHKASADILPMLFFLVLAYSSYAMRRQIIAHGGDFGEHETRREAWEQDPDWWKHR